MTTTTIEISGREYTIEACGAVQSDCLPDKPAARDVDVSLRVAGVAHDGGVTLVPSGDRNHRGLVAYGNDPSTWISGKLLNAIRELDLDDDSFSALLNAIEAAASTEAMLADEADDA